MTNPGHLSTPLSIRRPDGATLLKLTGEGRSSLRGGIRLSVAEARALDTYFRDLEAALRVALAQPVARRPR